MATDTKRNDTCPVCEQHTFDEPDCFEMCPICGWFDDPLQRAKPDFRGGCNEPCLNDAKAAYLNRNKTA